MGLFDKLFNTPSEPTSYSPVTEMEAWLGIMHSCMAADGDVSQPEINRMANMIVYKQHFKLQDFKTQYTTAVIVHKRIGGKAMIDACAPHVSADYRETLLAIVCELILADGVIDKEEKVLAEYITEKLEIPSENAMKIVEVMLIKNKGNKVFK
jgi:uncharacterized tellurite resistance protein B-like protein